MFQNGEKMMLIKLKASMENSILTHTENHYPHYVFNTEPESKRMIPNSPGYISNYRLDIYSYKNDKAGDRETYIVIFPKDDTNVPIIAERKRVLESPPVSPDGGKMPLPNGEEDKGEADPNTMYVYYGIDPQCEVCPEPSGGSKGLLIANVIVSLIGLVFVILFLVKGYIILCRKRKVVTSPSGEYQKKEDDSYQFNQSEDQKWGKNMENYQGQEDDMGEEKMDYGTNADNEPNVVFNQTGESSGYPPEEKKRNEASNEYRLNSTEKVISQNKEFF